MSSLLPTNLADFDLEHFLCEFETRRRDDDSALEACANALQHSTLPSRTIAETITELARIDMEYLAAQAGDFSAQRYVNQFPLIFDNISLRTQLAFEEFRLRRSRSEPISAQQIGARYAIDTRGWPDWSVSSNSSEAKFISGSVARPVESIAIRRKRIRPDYPSLGDTFAGYPLLAALGEGAYSRVFLAHQPDLAGRLVVLKVTPASTDESDKLASLQHSHIIPIYSLHRERDLSCICMPYLGSTTLADLLISGRDWPTNLTPAEEIVSTLRNRRNSTIAILSRSDAKLGDADLVVPTDGVENRDEAIATKVQSVAPYSESSLHDLASQPYKDVFFSFIVGAVEGLAFAHLRGVVHRDIKPANILISDEGTPLLLDFNLAATADSTDPWVVGGTLPYMSPQQLQTLLPNDSYRAIATPQPADDVFSVGVILYQMLSGRLPYDSHSMHANAPIDRMIADRLTLPAEIRSHRGSVSKGLQSIVFRCLAAAPKDRYQHAGELLEDLRCHQHHLPLKHAADRSIVERLAKWKRRHPALSSSAAMGIVATVLLAFALLFAGLRYRDARQLQARQELQLLSDELARATSYLTTPGREAELLQEGLRMGEAIVYPWHVDQEDWELNFPYSQLSPDSQAHAKQYLSRLVFEMSKAAADLALRDSDSSESLGGRAFVDYRRFIQQPSQDSSSARLSYSEGNFAEAIALTQAELAEHPTDATHWFNLATSQWQIGELASALQSFDMCQRLLPSSLAIRFNRGVCYLDAKSPEKALADFNFCVEQQEDFASARFNRALAYKQLSKPELALQDLDWLIQADVASARVFLLRYRLHRSLKNEEAAEQDLRSAESAKIRDVDDWLARGIQYLPSNPQKALEDFQRALLWSPTNKAALLNVAHVLAERLGNPREAIEYLDRLLRLTPQDPETLAARSVLLARTGQYDTALKDADFSAAHATQGLTWLQIAGTYSICITTAENESMNQRREQAYKSLANALITDPSLASVAATDPDLAHLHAEPLFRAIVSAANLLYTRSQSR